MGTIQLKRDADGNVFQVETTTTVTETPLDESDIVSQIERHSSIIKDLETKLEAVRSFKLENKLEADAIAVAVPEKAEQSIIDDTVLQSVSTIDQPEPTEPETLTNEEN